MTYKFSDFRKNLNEKGLQYALREDAKATRERHPHLSAIHDYGTAPARIFNTMAREAPQEAKGMFYLCGLASTAFYPALLTVGATGYAFDKTCLDKFKRD
ncbi:TPA: hypothetical protein HA251_05720 [Candidatus Woesearchaeota archaeon]|nr:hypothetical protein [Candidatus Woesearchaeota archaeon]